MKKITIAIDGHSSTGKSTVAKQIAAHLGYTYVDSGAMYRAVTLFAMQNNLISAAGFKVNELIGSLHDLTIDFQFNPDLGFSEVYLNGINVENQIRTLAVSSFVSQVAAIPEVRYQLVKQQRQIGEAKGVVMDGRDIGTVVFPNAEVKIFMTASAEVRAQRRFDELINRGDKVVFDEVLKNVKERDYIDSHRANSPLTKAEDAVVIDNSALTPEAQLNKILQIIQTALKTKR